MEKLNLAKDVWVDITSKILSSGVTIQNVSSIGTELLIAIIDDVANPETVLSNIVPLKKARFEDFYVKNESNSKKLFVKTTNDGVIILNPFIII